MAAVHGQPPFTAEIAFQPPLGLLRDDRDEQRAGADLTADLGVPRVAAAEFVLVKPYLDAAGAQAFRDAAGGRGVLVRVAEEDGAGR